MYSCSPKTFIKAPIHTWNFIFIIHYCVWHSNLGQNFLSHLFSRVAARTASSISIIWELLVRNAKPPAPFLIIQTQQGVERNSAIYVSISLLGDQDAYACLATTVLSPAVANFLLSKPHINFLNFFFYNLPMEVQYLTIKNIYLLFIYSSLFLNLL